jgi:hypothetical protein
MSDFSDLDLSGIIGHLDTVNINERASVSIQVFSAYGKVNHASYYFCPYCHDFRNIGVNTQKLSGNYPFCDCRYRNLFIQLPSEITYDIHPSSADNDIIIQGEVHSLDISVSNLSVLLTELRIQEMDLDSVIEVQV